MFVNIKTFFFDTCRNAKSVNLIKRFENDESHACCPCAYYECTEYLRSEKAPACTVKQSLTGGKQSGEDGSRETADACTELGPHGVVNFQCPVDEFHRINHQDAADGADDYRPEGRNHVTTGLMPTNPARMPFSVRDKEGLPYFIQLTANAKKPPAQAARLVVRNTCEMAFASSVVAAANCEPGLKPNHPNQRMNTPSAAIVRLCPGMGS